MAEQKEAVRASVASSLTSILGSYQLARKVAEEELKALEVTEEYGVVLAEMIASQETPVQYRQLASVLLKQYVEAHWTHISEKFQEPEIQDKTKVSIKELLPRGLADSQSKVRASVAYAISAIAHWDWPENWSNLFSQLAVYLESGEPNVVHGTLRVLTEFCHDVTEGQLEHVATAILPHLPKVIVQTDVYSVQTRTRAVHIYNLLAGIIFSISMVFQEAAGLVLFPSLALYMRTFLDILTSSSPSNTDHGLRKEVLMTVCHLLRSFPEAMAPHIMGVVTAVWDMLVTLTPEYLATVVNSDEVLEGACDSDGEVIGQESSLFAVFEFVSALGESGHWQQLLLPVLPQLLQLLILLMQITQEQCSSWMENVNRFVDEDDNEFSYSIRLSALELVQGMLEEEELVTPTYSAIMSAVGSHLETSSSSLIPWKLEEACMLVGGVLREGVKEGHVQCDMEDWVRSKVLPAITKEGCPLLNGRALLLAGKLASFLLPSLLQQLLEMVASGLLACQKAGLRVLSVKALYNFCVELKSTDRVQLLTKWLPDYMAGLCDLGSSSHEDVVFIIVDCLQMVARMDLRQTALSAPKLVPLAASLFLQYCHDPGISSGVLELFQALSVNPGCHAHLHSNIIPIVTDILTSTSDALPLGLVAGVLDVLVPIVRGCVVEGVAAVPPILLEQVFPHVVERVLESSDSSILQNGGECVRAFVAIAAKQLSDWRDQSGCSGLQYVLRVILHLLDPAMPEFCASFVGKLIIVFVKKVGRGLGQDLGLLLKAVLSKLHSVSSLSVSQSLLLVVAHLMQSELEETLLFLCGVPDPTGRPALNYVLQEWCSAHPYFFGCYETKLSTLALSKLLSHIIATNDQHLADIFITEQNADNNKEGVQTRSQRAAMATTQVEVRLPVKIVRLLVTDLVHHLHGDEEYEAEEEEEAGESMEATLEKLLAGAGGGAGGGDWEVEEDQDLADEPASQLNLLVHLQDYLLQLTKQPVFPSLRPHLTSQQLGALSSLGSAPS